MSPIAGERVLLRDFRHEDIPLIHGWVNDHDVTRFLLEGFPRTWKQTQRFVQAHMAGIDPLNHALAVSRVGDHSSIGMGGCYNIDWGNRAAELGIVIGETGYLGKGYGTEAIELLLVYGFRELNLHRMFLRVFDFNQRAIRSYRKCGFIEEGRLREAFLRDGVYHDIILMSILEDEHRARTEPGRG